MTRSEGASTARRRRRRMERGSFDGEEEEEEDEDDVANLLPDSIDVGVPDEFSGLGAVDGEAFEFGEREPFSAGLMRKQSSRAGEGDAEAVMRSLSLKSAKNVITAAKPVLESAAKHRAKPLLQYASPKFLSPRRVILQPR
ncbi:uncharacterized protein A4U43_C05F820 [Asparagus officinalis]|uniref:Uncharacterized protein n=1 Tax=Asparagus officinalis TaxID=4686 RepID=A0A5P1EPD2_ASPOF|nr:uncharacterized protein A4U43_C05F820 [Asparagus officinalis]